MPTQPAWVINDKILELAKQCVSADNPGACAREFGERLCASGWEQPDVDEVIKDALNIVGHLHLKSAQGARAFPHLHDASES